jgi:AraC-like DNA-binding protein
MTRPFTVGALQVVDLLTALGALGLEPAVLCRAVGLAPAVLRDPAARVPAPVVVALFVEAERRTEDPLIGLHAGELTEPRGPFAYLIMSHPRLEEGLRQAERFGHLPVDTMRVSLRRGSHTASLVLDLGAPFAASRHAADYQMMGIVRILRRAVGPGFPLREVHVRHADWRHHAEAERVFGCPVRCRQPENRLVFPLQALQARSRLGNPMIAEQIAKFAAALGPRLPLPSTFGERVAEITRALLDDGLRPDAATVAHALHVSSRTLQRRLDGERTTFKRVRDAAVWEVAEALLSNPSLKVETVALSVGFRQLAAFSKAFKRRAGCSPTQYRQRLVARTARRQRLRLVPDPGRSRA